MSIHVDLHDFLNAEATVLHNEYGWFSITEVITTGGSDAVFFTAPRATKVEAIMAAFELVDSLKAAITKMSDVVLTEDMEASVVERKLIEGGTEALPETIEDQQAAAREAALAHLPETFTAKVYDLSGPDGPVADSADGYRVTPGEVSAETGEDVSNGTSRRMADGRFENGS